MSGPAEAVVAATVGTFSRPWTWAVALAGFLVRGGLVAFIVPIVVVPTPTGLAVIFGPAIVSAALGGPNPGLLGLVALGVALAFAWLIAGGLIGAAADVALIRVAAAGDDEDPGSVGPLGPVVRVAIVRLLAHVPTAIAVASGVGSLIGTAYHELILPDELRTPLILRVVREDPGPVALIVGAWLLGETLGGLAARGLVLEDRPIGPAFLHALAGMVRRPVSTLLALAGGLLVVLLSVAPALLVAGLVWSRLGVVILGGGHPAAVLSGTVLLVTTWAGGLVLAGIATAWRSHLWTAEVLRHRPAATPDPAVLAGTTSTAGAVG